MNSNQIKQKVNGWIGLSEYLRRSFESETACSWNPLKGLEFRRTDESTGGGAMKQNVALAFA